MKKLFLVILGITLIGGMVFAGGSKDAAKKSGDRSEERRVGKEC